MTRTWYHWCYHYENYVKWRLHSYTGCIIMTSYHIDRCSWCRWQRQHIDQVNERAPGLPAGSPEVPSKHIAALPSPSLEGLAPADPWNTHKNPDVSPPLGMSVLFKALWGPSMPWPWALLDTVLSGQKSKMQRRKTKQRAGLVHARVQHFFSIFLAALIFFLRTGKHFPSKAYSGNDQAPSLQILLKSFAEPFLRSSREFVDWYNAEYESQAVKSEVQYKPYEIWDTGNWDMEPGKNTDEWMHVRQKHEVLIRWDTLWGKSINPQVCLHWWRSCPVQPMH